MLLLNFLFRLNYFLMTRVNLLTAKIKKPKLLGKLDFILRPLSRLNIFLVILIYIYLTLTDKMGNVFA